MLERRLHIRRDLEDEVGEAGRGAFEEFLGG